MELNFFTLVILSFLAGRLLRMLFNSFENKRLRNEVTSFINTIKTSLHTNKDFISAMEYNDRYTIVFKDSMVNDVSGMIKLFKTNKQLLVKDKYIQLTDKEYTNLLDTIKIVL